MKQTYGVRTLRSLASESNDYVGSEWIGLRSLGSAFPGAAATGKVSRERGQHQMINGVWK